MPSSTTGIHNSYFQILAEAGVLGLGLFLWITIAAWFMGVNLTYLQMQEAERCFYLILFAWLLSFGLTTVNGHVSTTICSGWSVAPLYRTT